MILAGVLDELLPTGIDYNIPNDNVTINLIIIVIG